MIDKLLLLQDKYPEQFTIVTGFNTDINHLIIEEKNDHYIKNSMGGINMLFTKDTYINIIRPTLNTLQWDCDVCSVLKKENGLLLCTKPSVIDHIGENGLWSQPDKYNKSIDF